MYVHVFAWVNQGRSPTSPYWGGTAVPPAGGLGTAGAHDAATPEMGHNGFSDGTGYMKGDQAMEYSGQGRVAATPQAVWDFLTDPNRYGACAEGFKNVKVVDDRRFTFELHAYGQRLKCEGTWLERDAPRRAVMQIQGGDFFGKAKLVNTVELEPDGDGTLVRWHADVNLSGVIAMVVGDRIGPMVERINQSVLACVEREVATG